MVLVGVELEALVSQPDALTTSMCKLCTDILLRHDFQSLHKQVVLSLAVLKTILWYLARCVLYQTVLLLFHRCLVMFHANTSPFAVKLRQFNKTDQEFTHTAISRLCSEGIIKPSVSPWLTQVAIVKDAENNKHRLCTDYSQTIHLFTELDARILCLELM